MKPLEITNGYMASMGLSQHEVAKKHKCSNTEHPPKSNAVEYSINVYIYGTNPAIFYTRCYILPFFR